MILFSSSGIEGAKTGAIGPLSHFPDESTCTPGRQSILSGDLSHIFPERCRFIKHKYTHPIPPNLGDGFHPVSTASISRK